MSEARTPWEEAAYTLHESGFLHLGIKDRPKPIADAEAIIQTACEQHSADLRAELERVQAQAAALDDALEGILTAGRPHSSACECEQCEAWDKAANLRVADIGRDFVPLEWAQELVAELQIQASTWAVPPQSVIKTLAKWKERTETKEGK